MRTFAVYTLTVLALLASAVAVSAKPERVPIRVESSVPRDMKTGDEVTTTITIRALANIDRVEVSIAPFEGLELLSETKQVVFTGMREGEGRGIQVTVRLTGQKFGSLAFVYTTQQGTTKESGATTVVFGGQ
jgi:hypothetical protein